jgi:anti-anti-sigma regulatory factor
MGKFSLEGSADTKKLVAEGRLTIQDAARLKELLIEAYDSTGSLLVDLAGTESVDLACFQVFCSAHRSFLKSRKSIGITKLLPEEVKRNLEAVAVDPANCILKSPEQCFWVTGGSDE